MRLYFTFALSALLGAAIAGTNGYTELAGWLLLAFMMSPAVAMIRGL